MKRKIYRNYGRKSIVGAHLVLELSGIKPERRWVLYLSRFLDKLEMTVGAAVFFGSRRLIDILDRDENHSSLRHFELVEKSAERVIDSLSGLMPDRYGFSSGEKGGLGV